MLAGIAIRKNILTVEQLECRIGDLLDEAMRELRRNLDEAIRQSNLIRKKAEYFRLLSLPYPYREFSEFVSKYYRDKRKEGVKDRFKIALMYRAEYGPWEEEWKIF